MEGYVYIIFDGKHGLTKIGRSQVNHKNRWLSHQGASPFPLYLVDVFKCDNYKFIEKELHRRLKDKKVKTEWFIINPPKVIELIYELTRSKCVSIFSIEDHLLNILTYNIGVEGFELIKNGVVPIYFKKGAKIKPNIDVEKIAEKLKSDFVKSISNAGT